MNIDKNSTAAFTGHRTYDGMCDEALRSAVRSLYESGYRTFLTGMAIGFDIAAGECVADMRCELSELRLHCVVPFEGQQRSFGSGWRERFERLLRAADDVTVLAPNYTPYAYHIRNDFLVDNSSALIAYYDGTAGGTEYTLRRAVRAGSRIENLWNGLFDV